MVSLLCYADRIPNILGIGIFDYTDPKFVVEIIVANGEEQSCFDLILQIWLCNHSRPKMKIYTAWRGKPPPTISHQLSRSLRLFHSIQIILKNSEYLYTYNLYYKPDFTYISEVSENQSGCLYRHRAAHLHV